jgi:hypothetical protein
MRSAEDDDKPRLGEAFSSGSHQFADAITAAEPAAEDLLADVKLTKRLRRRVCPLLESLGFVITEQQRCDEVGVTCKKVEVAFKDPVSFVLLHMPKTLLATPSGPNVAAVGYLPHVLDAGDRVLIFSDGLKGQPKPPYRKMWSIWAGEGKVTAAFVAWDDVEFILDKPDDERMATLAQVLDVTFGTDSALLAAQAEAPAHAPVGGNGGGLAVAPRRPPPDVTLTRAETDLFARVLSEQAFGAPVKPQDYFNDLADRSDARERRCSASSSRSWRSRRSRRTCRTSAGWRSDAGCCRSRPPRRSQPGSTSRRTWSRDEAELL